MADKNPIPSIRAAGKFVALPPFDRVVDPAVFYSVEAIRTLPEMQGLNINIYDRVFKPIGLAQEDYPAVISKGIAENTVVVSLVPRVGSPVYVLSTYLESFPLVDGVSYERMCIVSDIGALPPSAKVALQGLLTDIDDLVFNNFGVKANTTLGTVPVIGYLSQSESDIMENTRKNRIRDSDSMLVKYNRLLEEKKSDAAYIKELEGRLGVK